jgi:hypothetical protein
MLQRTIYEQDRLLAREQYMLKHMHYNEDLNLQGMKYMYLHYPCMFYSYRQYCKLHINSHFGMFNLDMQYSSSLHKSKVDHQ